jgi:hypothetical protein
VAYLFVLSDVALFLVVKLVVLCVLLDGALCGDIVDRCQVVGDLGFAGRPSTALVLNFG